MRIAIISIVIIYSSVNLLTEVYPALIRKLSGIKRLDFPVFKPQHRDVFGDCI